MQQEIIDHQSFWSEEDGTECRADIYLSGDFSDIGNVSQVYSFILNDNKTQLLIAKHRKGPYTLPGGHVEKGETLIQTLIREIKEETNKEIFEDEIIPFFYQKTFRKKLNSDWEKDEIQVRYITFVKNNDKFISDPDGDIVENEWINIEDLEKYLDWGKTTKMVLSEIKKYIK